MNTQTYVINIRAGSAMAPKVKVSQGDVGRILSFKIFDGAFAFTPAQGSTVTITGTKPSGLGFTETCTLSGNTATVSTTLDMTQESGDMLAELRIANGSASIGSVNFVLSVERAPHQDGTTDGTYETMDDIQTQIGDLSELATSEKSSLVGAINEAAQSGGSEITVDDTLTTAGAAADAKKTGDEISAIKADLEDLDERVEALEGGGGGSGLTDDVKTALMNIVNHIAWDDDDPTGQTYITSLYNALYPPADLVSISAVYTQSGTVYNTDTLDSLKSDLVITAVFSDSTSHTVSDYVLSGNLAVGTSTILVTYGGKTATFNVTVSTHLMYSLYNHEFTGDPVESPYIDTGIKLFDTDFSWTIICSVSREAAADHYGWRLFNALQPASPYNGFYHGSSNTVSSGRTNVKWVGNNSNAVNEYMKKAFVGTYKCVFVHQKNGGLQMYFKGNDDAVITKTDSNTWTQITDAVSLGIGGVNGNGVDYAFTGTINKFEVYDYAFGSTAINAFMEGS